MLVKWASYQLMPDRIKLKSQDLVKRLADTVLHSEVICIKLYVWYNIQHLNCVTFNNSTRSWGSYS